MNIELNSLQVALLGILFVFGQFVLIGIEKAFIEPLAKRFVQRKTIKYAPIAMQFLDQKLGQMIANGSTGRDIEQSLRNWLEEKTGEEWPEREVDRMFNVHDIRLTADSLNHEKNSNQ